MAKRGGFPGGMPGNMTNLMKQAQRMQRQMEEATKELEAKEYTAQAGGGAVSVTVSGNLVYPIFFRFRYITSSRIRTAPPAHASSRIP